MKMLITTAIFFSLSVAMATTTENRIRIAVIDTGVNVSFANALYICKDGNINITDDTDIVADSIGHGTNIVSLLIVGLNPRHYCIEVIKYCKICKPSEGINISRAIHLAYNASYINMSFEGSSVSDLEYRALAGAINRGIKVAVAAGNDGLNLDTKCSIFPACYAFNNSNFHVVGSSTGALFLSKPKNYFVYRKYSNYGNVVKYLEDGTEQGVPCMTGTSQSTAIHLNKWVRGLVK